MLLLRKALSFAFFLAIAAFADQWLNFTVPYPNRDAVVFNSQLFLATASGVRSVDSSGNSSVYTSASGLSATEIAFVGVSEKTLYAVSKNGIISKFLPSAKKFQVVNRSMEEKSIQVVAGAIQNEILVIASLEKLSYFDLKKGEFILSVSGVENIRFADQNPTALFTNEDSLWVSAGQFVYSRALDWKNLRTDRFLSDPNAWRSRRESFFVRGLNQKTYGNVLAKETPGSWFWKDGLEYRAAEDTSSLILKGKKVRPAALFKNDSSVVRWIFPHGKGYFFAGSNFVGFGSVKNVRDFSNNLSYFLGGAYEMTTHPSGGVLVSGLDSRLSHFEGSLFSYPYSSNSYGWTNAIDGPGHLMKALSVLPTGEALYSVWGGGVEIYKDYTSGEKIASVRGGGASCMDDYLSNYLIVASALPAPDASGFLVSYWNDEGYGIAYVDLYGDIYCASGLGSTPFSGVMAARMAENASFEVFIAATSAANIGGTGKIERFLFAAPSKSGSSLRVLSRSEIQMPEHEFPLDMAFDSEGRLWAIGYTSFGFWESGDSLRPPHRVSQFSASALTSLALDPHGGIWIGSQGGGAYHLKRKGKSVDTLSAVRYRMRDGLQGDVIYDLALDSASGVLWFAQDVGISVLIRKDLRSASSFMTDSAAQDVKVYPNPFRPNLHEKIKFDYLSEDSRVSVFNAGGHLVYSAEGDALSGGTLEWDGKDASGNLVSPGVYRYLIKRGKTVKKGKLLIIH